MRRTDTAESTGVSHAAADVANLRVALLTNIIPPFRNPLFQELSRRCKQFRVFLSTPMEANRRWQVDWAGLDVTLQRTATLTRRIGHNASADEQQFVHFPIDTVPALMRFKPHAVLSSELGFRTIGAVLYRLLAPKSRLLTWVCVSESTEAQRGKLRHAFRKLLLKGIDGFLVNGASGSRYLQKLGVPAHRIFRAPYPTDLKRFSRNGDLTRDGHSMRRLLYVGQFVERKGLLPFLRILARWASAHPSSQVEFLLVGSGPLAEALRNTGLPSNLSLEIRAFIPYDEIIEIYRCAGIFVFPSLADEWGAVVTEAMACGLPVLGSCESQAVEELVAEEVNGWVFHPAREEQVFDAIGRCLETPEAALSQMRYAARIAALRLSPEAIADLVIAAVRDCAEAR